MSSEYPSDQRRQAFGIVQNLTSNGPPHEIGKMVNNLGGSLLDQIQEVLSEQAVADRELRTAVSLLVLMR
jgi:hypothetical protein